MHYSSPAFCKFKTLSVSSQILTYMSLEVKIHSEGRSWRLGYPNCVFFGIHSAKTCCMNNESPLALPSFATGQSTSQTKTIL